MNRAQQIRARLDEVEDSLRALVAEENKRRAPMPSKPSSMDDIVAHLPLSAEGQRVRDGMRQKLLNVKTALQHEYERLPHHLKEIAEDT